MGISKFKPFFTIIVLFISFFQLTAYAAPLKNEPIEEVITIGTRRNTQSVNDSAVPVDIISSKDFINQGDTDMDSLLSSLIPSYNVNAQPISDAGTIVRPANLRGLPPDNTLILVNGKRRHRAAVISFLGGGVSDGAQGPDLSVIPAIALKQVTVLRDGASAQYGSDAIAGVLNFDLKDAINEGSIEAQWGQYKEGDGEGYQVSANYGFGLGKSGFINLSAEIKETDPTVRSVQRDDAAALIAAGNTDIRQPVSQVWGSPELRDDYKLFANMGFDLNENTKVYAFGNLAQREVEGGFFFRNPTNRGGVFDGPIDPASGLDTILVADLTSGPNNDGIACPTLTISGSGVVNASQLATVAADPNCFAYNSLTPGGFTPQFSGEIKDSSFFAGIRGKFKNSLNYDFSIGTGKSDASFFITNTINPQLAAQGLDQPRNFAPGGYIQKELTANADFTYPITISGLASDLNLAFGFEYRDESFEIIAGGVNSYFIDTQNNLGAQGFGIGSNGFPGFRPTDAGKSTRDNIATYIDLEVDITDTFLLAIAARYEDFSDFGSTLNGKIAARLQISDKLALRSSVSTGFRAPTIGQSNVRNVTTAFTGGILSDEATLPPANPVSIQLGAKPLQPEESLSFSFGTLFSAGEIDFTIDYFNINIDDRIALTTSIPLTTNDINTLLSQGVTDASSFSSVRFFSNDFETTTQGLDLVADYPEISAFGGTFDIKLSYNWTDTKVKQSTLATPTRIRQIEDNIPKHRLGLTTNFTQNNWYLTTRVNYYDGYYEAHLDDGELPINAGAEITVDAEVQYNFENNVRVSIGAKNLFDQYPDENPHAGIAGALYPTTSPFGFNGAYYYIRSSYNF